MRLGLVVGSLVLILASSGSAAWAPSDNSRKALEVLQKTKSTRATYAVYNRDHVNIHGEEPFVGTSAEFHSGTLHRVETSFANAIADCEKEMSWSLEFSTGKRQEGTASRELRLRN